MAENKEFVIKPEFSDVFCWELIPTEKYIKVLIKITEGFDTNLVKYELNEQKDAVSIRYPEQPPIVEGKLFGKVNNLTKKIYEKEKLLTFTFDFDALEKEPDFLIVDFNQETGKIDPLSSFLLFNKLQEEKDEKVRENCFKYLKVGVDTYFVPSMIAASSLFQRIKGLEERSLELICIAADRYNSPAAQLHMGLFFINNPAQKEKAIDYITKASREPDLPIAKSILGVLLSPISDMESPKKDAKKAAELFEEALKVERHPMALHELAMLLYNGIGVEKDVERAKQLNEECTKLEHGQTAPLTERDESYVPKKPQPGNPECHCHDCHCEHEHEHEHEGKHEKCHCHDCHCDKH